MPATPRRSTQPALWPHGRPALHISGARPAIQISGVSASRGDAAALFGEGEAPAEPQSEPLAEPLSRLPAPSSAADSPPPNLPAAHPPPAANLRNSCDWSPSKSSEEQPCGVWSDVLTATDGDRWRQMATETIRIGHGAGAGWGGRYSFANSHRARSDRRPECRDRWALLFAKADFLNGFSGPIFCSTLPAGDSITLVVCMRFQKQ